MKRPVRTVLGLVVLVVAVAVVVLVAITSHTGGHSTDKAACKAAMQRQFAYGMKHPDAPAGTKPVACRGVSDDDLKRFASEIMNDYLNSGS